MAARLKVFFFGLVVGSSIAFLLGMNYGRGAPFLSNPFAERDIGGSVKQRAGEVVEGAREKLHEVTKPEPAKK